MNIGRSYKKYGLVLQPNGDLTYTEWAPAAKRITLFGDFNYWNRDEFPCSKNEFGCFTITLKANADGTPRIGHNQKYKIQVEGPDGKKMDRNSAWATYQVQETSTFLFHSVFWNPPEKFVWTHRRPIPIPE